MSAKTLVIVGNGMAANRVLEQLGIDHPFDAIHVLSDEAIPHYNRIMLSPLLAQETTLEAITPHNALWYQQRHIQIHLNAAVDHIDTQTRHITTVTGEQFPYTALVLATGSRSSIPPLPGLEHKPANVLGFRTMTDVDAMLAATGKIQHATVIGAGLLGVEAAVGLKSQGLNVTLMHRNPVLMNRQLDATASGILQRELESRGVDVRTGVNPLNIDSDATTGLATAIHYEDRADKRSHTLNTDLIVFATGIIPNAEQAKAAGLDVGRGIKVNSRMHASAANTYSLGECCEFEGATYGLVAPIWEQAKTLAHELLRYKHYDHDAQHIPAALESEHQPKHYCEQDHLTKLKVSGVDMHSMGRYEPEEGDEVMNLQDLAAGVYKKLVINNNRIVGVLCVGDVLDSGWYFDLLCQQADISDLRTNLLFGKAWCEDVA